MKGSDKVTPLMRGNDQRRVIKMKRVMLDSCKIWQLIVLKIQNKI